MNDQLLIIANALAANRNNPNRLDIIAKLTVSLADNKTYLALTPTVAQNTAQIKALTRQNNKIIRLLTNLLDAVD